jgi:trehalose 6-phosphate phosphatase
VDGREELDGSVRPYVQLAQSAMKELAPLRRIEGVLLEDKVTGVAIHYRLARNGEEARAGILRGIAAAGSAAHFDLLEGVRVIELRPRLGINKGTSVRSLVNRFRLEGLIYAGDDLTDVEAFEAVRDLRSGGRIEALSVAVRHEESAPEVEAAADYAVEGVGGVERLLAYTIRTLGGSVPEAG